MDKKILYVNRDIKFNVYWTGNLELGLVDLHYVFTDGFVLSNTGKMIFTCTN